MGISDDIRQKKKELPKKKALETLGPDEIKIRYSREEDEEEDTNIKQERSQIEDEFFAKDNKDIIFHHPAHQEDNTSAEHETESVKSVSDEESPQPKKHGNPMTKWVVLLIFVLIALLTWQNWSKISKLIGLNPSDSADEEQLQNYSSNVAGTDYTAVTTQQQPTDSAASSNSSTTTATQTPSINKSQITIQILNGNGITGSASKVKSQLENAGFTIDSVTNAYKFTYPSTIIYYKTGKSAEADLVKSALSDRQCELTNNDSVTGNYDVVVVIGKT